MRALLAAAVLLAMLVDRSTAQLSFSPVFPVSQYDTVEGQNVVVRLSETILTTPGLPPFNGTICVDVIAEDLADGANFLGATFLTDYIVNLGNVSSRIFTCCFQPLQSNSTENVIQISDDAILEGRECFRLRLVAARFTGTAADLFIPQEGLTNTFVDVCIEDNDIVQVNWTISDAVSVSEGDGVIVRLRGEAFGIYANEIAIGVVCSETIATDVEPAFPGRDFNFTLGTKLHFTEVGEPRSTSVDEVIIPIINDGIAEPRESFICTLQGGIVDTLQVIFPSQVTIEIRDDDELIVRWAQDFYEFQESEVATVELVTDSDFEISRITILGFPEAIPEGSPKRIPSLSVPGPLLSGFIFDATIKQAQFRGISYGAAEVTQAGRTDVLQTINDFVFTPASKSAFGNFTIVGEPTDGVLECDELFQAEFNFGPEIENNWNVRKGTPSITYILIRDDDSVTVNFNEDSYSVTESAGNISVSLRIDGKFFKPVYAIIEVSDATATAPEDYTSAIRYNVTFRQTTFQDSGTPADTAISETFFINITDDDILEGLEYFQVRIVETSDEVRVRIGQDTVNVTIIDDDSVVVRYDTELYQVQEEAGPVTLTLVLEGDAMIDVTVSVNTQDLLDSSEGDAATAELDYTPRDPFEFTFPAGIKEQSYTVIIVNDAFPENSEFFNADVNAIPQVTPHVGPSVIIGSPKQPLIEIIDETDVQLCGLTCQNGGLLLDPPCMCVCQPMYTGEECETNMTVVRCNDTIIGDPLYEVPVTVDGVGSKISLCYEVHGEPNQNFNLISDTCVSVNALYSPMINVSDGNIISKIGILAEDNNGTCQQIEVDLEGCTASVGGLVVTNYDQDGVNVMRRSDRVRIAVPNCIDIELVMWVVCEVRNAQPMIRFVVARGFNLRSTSHGLIGQFWNVKVEAEKYNVTAEDKIAPAANHYAVTVTAPDGSTRRFFGWRSPRTWDKKSMTCLYSGDSQGGLLYEVTSLSDPVIQGTYDEYVVSSLFDPDYKYEMFDSQCN